MVWHQALLVLLFITQVVAAVARRTVPVVVHWEVMAVAAAAVQITHQILTQLLVQPTKAAAAEAVVITLMDTLAQLEVLVLLFLNMLIHLLLAIQAAV
jgi:hypothetical protein